MTNYWRTKPPFGTDIDFSHPQARGLMGCWLFNEGGGLRVNDLSSRGNHGTLTNFEPMSSDSGWCGGLSGSTLRFDGVNDYVVAGNRMNLSVPYSIEGRVKIPTNPGTNNRDLISLSTSAGGFPRVSPNFWTSNKPLIQLSNSHYKYGSTALSDDKWHHIVFIINTTADISKIYVDGIEEAYGATLTTDSPSTPSGRAYIGTNKFNGTIDNTRIWNRALSSEEIKSLYLNPYEMFRRPKSSKLPFLKK